MCVLRGCMCTMAHVQKIDKWEPVLSFHYMGSGTELNSIRLGGKYPYPMSHFSSLKGA